MKTIYENGFLDQYLGTALWSSSYLDENDEMQDMDREFSIDDFAQDAIELATKDCEKFIGLVPTKFLIDLDDDEITQIAHDFWLTRNGHGAGFWDGDYEPETEKVLMEAVKEFKECNVCIGDDKLLYLFDG